MSDRKHDKHPKLIRSEIKNYHRCEWAIYGTTCSNILSYYQMLESEINGLALVDADHASGLEDLYLRNNEKQFVKKESLERNLYDDRLQELQCNAVFVNGNHYPAARQVVFIDELKKASLKKRVSQLEQIDVVIVKESKDEIFDFILERMNKDTLIYKMDQLSEQVTYFKEEIYKSMPKLKAVVLAGGKSQRMGQDKSALIYHNDKPQQIFLAELCQSLGLETYLSKSHLETASSLGGFEVIKDRFVDLGPQGAILSAMMIDPNAAWLVIACDLPLVNKTLVQELIAARAVLKYATAFKKNKDSFPEPLITIYEPRSYQRMLSFLSLGYRCPRKVLINSAIKAIVLEDESLVDNANTPEEKDMIFKKLNLND